MTDPQVASPLGYDAAQNSVVRFDRSHHTRLMVSGRAPGQMLSGVLTGTIPSAPGRRHYSTVLTPKGRMITDLFLVRMPGDDERYLLDVSPAGREALLDYFKRVLPPRFAKVTDVGTAWKHEVLVGPDSTSALEKAFSASGVDGDLSDALDQLHADDALHVDAAGASVVVVRSPDSIPPRFDLYVEGVPTENGGVPAGFHDSLVAAVPTSGSEAAWSALRLEAGTPEFGTDMVEKTIPIEAGIEERAIDSTKGCYTGQEVIVRILHRGHVNRHLRTLKIEAGAEGKVEPNSTLYVAGSDKPVGEITSVAESPLAAGTIALGYVRREVEVGNAVQVGSPSGITATVFERGPLVG